MYGRFNKNKHLMFHAGDQLFGLFVCLFLRTNTCCGHEYNSNLIRSTSFNPVQKLYNFLTMYNNVSRAALYIHSNNSYEKGVIKTQNKIALSF